MVKLRPDGGMGKARQDGGMGKMNYSSHSLQEAGPGIRDYWRVLAKRRRLVGAVVAAAFLSSLVISLVLPEVYAATARILPPLQDSGPYLSLLSQEAGGLGGLAQLTVGQKSTSDVWMEVLKSDTVLDAVISRFGLKQNGEPAEHARAALGGRVGVRASKAGVISITAEDTDRRRAAELANAFVEELDRFNREQVMSSGTRKRTFMEERLLETKSRLARDEEALKRFREANGAVKIDSQTEGLIDNIGKVKGQVMAKEVELRTMLSYAAPDNPRVGMLKSELAEMKIELAKLEYGGSRTGRARGGDIFIPASDIPKLSDEYARLMRNVKMQETLYGLLESQYEQARIQEAKDSPTVQVMDKATAPETSAKPNRKAIIVLSTAASAFASVFMAFFLEYLERNGLKAC